MVMAPCPILSLLARRAAAKIPMTSMSFTFPAAVKADFIIIPYVIVIVIAVMNAVTSAYTSRTATDNNSRENVTAITIEDRCLDGDRMLSLLKVNHATLVIILLKGETLILRR
jgi:hypothetical protein